MPHAGVVVPLPLASPALGQAIKARMAGLGLENKDIAGALGLSEGTVSRSLSGTTPIKPERYAALAAVLGVDQSWFGEAAAIMQALMAGKLPGQRGDDPRASGDERLAAIERQLNAVLEAVRPTTPAEAPAGRPDDYVEAISPKPTRRSRRARSPRKSANG